MRSRFVPLREAVRQATRTTQADDGLRRKRFLRIEEELRERGVPLVINKKGRAYCPHCKIRIWHYTRYCPNCTTMIRW